jgi:hypothetical protein
MSLNDTAEVGVAGFGGILPGQYEPLAVPVTTKTSNSKLVGALVRGDVITTEKAGANKGGIRIAVSGDVGPFGMCYKDAGANDTRVEFISLQLGFIGYLIADGALEPGANVVVASTAGQVIQEAASATAVGSNLPVVGTYISKAIEVNKSTSGVSKPSDAADGDIVRVAFGSNRGEIF